MSLVRDLRAARALIADPKNWCQGSFATNAAGRAIHIRSIDARRFCAYGAVDSATWDPGRDRTDDLIAARDALVAQPTVGFDLMIWNDARTRKHADVLGAFDGAIEDAEMLE